MIKVYDRDGKERGTSVSGDMYIRDLRNTKGHISPCTHAQWHPTDKFTGMTSSEDGSIRVWDTWNVLQKTVIKPQLAKPGRIAVTACAYNHDGGLIGGGMFDGTLQIWDVKGVLQMSCSVMICRHTLAMVKGASCVSSCAVDMQLLCSQHVLDCDVVSPLTCCGAVSACTDKD